MHSKPRSSAASIGKSVSTWLAAALMLFAVVFPSLASGPSSNRILNYQLRLTDSNGIPVADGAMNLKLTFYTAPTGGTQLYSVCSSDGTPTGTPTAVSATFTNGSASVLIGDTTVTCASGTAVAIPATLFDNAAIYLGVTVSADAEMTPRKRIVAAGYALNADKLDNLDTSNAGGTNAFVPVTDSSGNFTLTKNVTFDTTSFFVDATAHRVGVGDTTPAALFTVGSGDLFQVDTSGNVTTAGTLTVNGTTSTIGDSTTDRLNIGGEFRLGLISADPTGTNGLMYYNTSTNKFRCYQSGAWTDCVATSTAIGNTVASGTTGSVLFVGASSALSQDNANFFWDDTNNRLGLGDATPAATLTVGSGDLFQVDGATGNVTTSGDAAVNGGDLTTGASTFNLVNANATTLNIGGAATTLALGASTGTATINNATVTLANATTLNINGASPSIVTSSSGTASVFNTNATTVNIGGAATTMNVGPAGSGSAVVNLAGGDADTGCTVNGSTGNLTCSGTVTGAAFAPGDTNPTTDNSFDLGTATVRWRKAVFGPSGVEMSSTTGTSGAGANYTKGTLSFSGTNLVLGTTAIGSGSTGTVQVTTGSNIGLNIDASGNVGVGDATPAALFTVGTSDAFQVDASGNITTSGDLAVNGGDLTTSALTFNLINTNATTLNIGGAATTLALGATSGTSTVRNNLTVNGTAITLAGNSTIIDMTGTGTLGLNTTTNRAITTGTGLFTVNGGLAVNTSGNLTTDQTIFNLINTNATTLNLGGAATTLSIGAATGTATVNNSIAVNGNTTLGDATSDTITTTARFASSLTPSADNTYDLGTTALRWKTLHLGPGSVVVHNDATNTDKVTLGFSGATAQLVTNSATPLQLATDSNNGITVSTKGDVGIGTTSPVSLLDVAQATTGPGTVTTNGTTTLSGTNTEFTNTFKVGDTITVSGETVRTIATIPSNTSLTVTSAFSTSASGLSYTLTGGTRLSVKGNSYVGIGTTTPGRTLDVNGNWGGNAVNDQQSLTSNSTVTESTKAVTYYLSNNSGTTNASVTTTFNITGLPDIDGTFAFVQLKAQKGVTSAAQVQTVNLDVNGTFVTLVGTSNTTNASALAKNFTLVRINGNWTVVGAAGDGSGTTSAGSFAKTVLTDLTNNTTTMQNTELSFTMGANETWSAFFALRSFNSINAADVRYDLTSPSGATCYLSAGSFANGTSVDTTSCTGTVTPQVGVTDEFVILQFTVVNGATPGAATLRFASTVAGDVAHVDAGSHMAAFIDQGADVAEAYYSTDPSIGPGTVVKIDRSLLTGVAKTMRAYDPDVLGVISTMPGLAMGEKAVPAGTKPVYLALAGRVPVYVNDENGPIGVGDYLTASSTPGVAMKSTRPGPAIGRALDSYAGPGVGMIDVFAETGWNSADAIGTDGTSSIFKDNFTFDKAGAATADAPASDSKSLSFRGSAWDAAAGQAEDREITLVNTVTGKDAYRLSMKNADGDEVSYFGSNGDIALKGGLYPSDRGTLQTKRSIFYDGSAGFGGDMMRTNAAGWASRSNGFAEMFPSADSLESGELVMIDTANPTEVLRAKKDDAHASFLLAGIVSTEQGFLAGMNDAGNYPIALQGRVSTRVVGPVKIGDPITFSPTPGVGTVATDPTYIVGIALTAKDDTGPGMITVFVKPGWFNGAAKTPEAVVPAAAPTIAGSPETLTVTDNTVDVGRRTLMQVGTVEGIDGLWSIDANGLLTAKGIAAEKVKAKEFTVHADDATQTIGEGIVPVGDSAVTVNNPAVKPNSRIFVTFFNNTEGSWWISRRVDGAFDITLAKLASTDLHFEYWIMQVDDQRTPPAPPAPPTPPVEPATVPASAVPATDAGTTTGGAAVTTDTATAAPTDTTAAPTDTTVTASDPAGAGTPTP